MMKRILVGVAGTPALGAKIEMAIGLARRFDAEIGVVSVVDVERLAKVGPVPLGAGAYAARLRKHRVESSHRLDDAAIETFAKSCEAAKVRMQAHKYEGNPLEILASLYRYHDLCVLGARGWFDYDVVPQPGDALLKVIAAGIRPVIAVTERLRPIRRAVIGYNGSIESSRAMKLFLRLALWPTVDVHIVCVNAPKSEESVTSLLDASAAYARLQGYEVKTAQAEGTPWNALLDYAYACGADMIVAGSSARRILLTRRVGRNVLGLVKSSDLPLFLSN